MEHTGANEPAISLRSLDVKNAASYASLNAFSTLQLVRQTKSSTSVTKTLKRIIFIILAPIMFLYKYIWQVAYQRNFSQTKSGEQAF